MYYDGYHCLWALSVQPLFPGSLPMLVSLRSVIVLMAVSVVCFSSCRKEEEEPPATTPVTPRLTLSVEHHVDGMPVLFDSLAYINEAGHAFSISRIEHYISEVVLLGINGTPNDTLHGPFLVNAGSTERFDLGHSHAGEYAGATLLLGLPASLNVTGGLPNTVDNLNMAWPGPMGGGYHFLKFEGHFMNGTDLDGFAMHLGTNACLPVAGIAQPFTLDGASGTITLRYNMNEMFRTPHTYDLAAGNYSMGNAALMTQIAENAADAFTIAYAP